jgi:beta-mannosidase
MAPNRTREITQGWSLLLDYPGYEDPLPATVPGCIHTDLINHGLITDIAVHGNEANQSWIWRTDSSYETVIAQDPRLLTSHLIFHGLDTLATIFINGVSKLSTKNMHRSYRVDITEEIQLGDVRLTVKFRAPLTDAEDQVEKLGIYPRPYDMPYNYQRKMACSYGWDWGPTTITSGIWKSVELFQFESSFIEDFTAVTSIAKSIGLIQVSCTIGGAQGKRILIEVRDGATVIFSEVRDQQAIFDIELADVELWYPRGLGNQKLYAVTLSLLEADEVIESKTKQIGFRTIELDTSKISEDKHLFAIKVNGQRVWIRGANWIPDDPFPSRMNSKRYRARIEDMLEVNINAIRVWGGGIYESEDFYRLCDQAGIVVWQDFLFACAAYPETPEMFEEVRAEAIAAVNRLKSHASLVLWCGGNECLEGFQHWGWSEILQGKPWGESFYRSMLPEIIGELDGTRPYIPGSPFSTHDVDVKSFNSGTNHIWDVWNELGYERYEEYSPAFNAEFGYSGPGSFTMLAQSIGKPNLDSLDADLSIHQKALNGMTKLENGLIREFARQPVRGYEWYFATALVQARAVEVGLKHFRSLYDTCSGTVLWQFNDMWPAISWSVLDHTGFRKLAWHAMKSAYDSRSLFIGRADQGSVLTVLNDSKEPWESLVTITLINDQGEVVQENKRAVELQPFSVFKEPLLALFPQISDGGYEGFLHVKMNGFSTVRRTTMKPARTAPRQEFSVQTEIVNSKLMVTVTAHTYLHELCVLPELFVLGTNVDSQLVSLLPGEIHVFTITGQPADLEAVDNNLIDLIWSHNRLVNGSW